RAAHDSARAARESARGGGRAATGGRPWPAWKRYPTPPGRRARADRCGPVVGNSSRPRVLRLDSHPSGLRPRPAATATCAGGYLALVSEPSSVILPQIQIARAHWVLGALFLAIILEEYVPLVGRDGRPLRSRS